MTAVVWQLVFGLGIFLYGMSRLETGLRDVSGAGLKRWLLQFTSSQLSSASFGVFVTTLLQSSSMVSLLVLAFASAGIIPLYNGIGVLLGANVGTTATGWLVATLGFKLDLEQMAIPLIGLGCIGQIMLKRASRGHAVGMVVFGLGLLLFGLSLMKSSVSNLPESWDIEQLQGQPAVLYLLAGMLLTALIQSSSAVMMLTLTALYGQLISLPEAAALVIGADIGTTSTTLLGSLTGSAVKKRLALAHLIFNLTVDLAAFVVLLPLLPQLLALLSITDPLYSLVAFHSTFNLLGLLCFLPFLKPFSSWIGRRFVKTEARASVIEKMPADVPEAALTAVAAQVRLLMLQALFNNLKHFNISLMQLNNSALQNVLLDELSELEGVDWKQQYQQIKDHEDELMHFVLRMQQQPLDEEQAQQLTKMLELTRAMVYFCKTLKDIHQNLEQLQCSRNEQSLSLFKSQQGFHNEFYRRALLLVVEQHAQDYMREELESMQLVNDQHHLEMTAGVYAAAGDAHGSGPQVSTQLNVNNEIHHANKSLLSALVLWLELRSLLTVSS